MVRMRSRSRSRSRDRQERDVATVIPNDDDTLFEVEDIVELPQTTKRMGLFRGRSSSSAAAAKSSTNNMNTDKKNKRGGFMGLFKSRRGSTGKGNLTTNNNNNEHRQDAATDTSSSDAGSPKRVSSLPNSPNGTPRSHAMTRSSTEPVPPPASAMRTSKSLLDRDLRNSNNNSNNNSNSHKKKQTPRKSTWRSSKRSHKRSSNNNNNNNNNVVRHIDDDDDDDEDNLEITSNITMPPEVHRRIPTYTRQRQNHKGTNNNRQAVEASQEVMVVPDGGPLSTLAEILCGPSTPHPNADIFNVLGEHDPREQCHAMAYRVQANGLDDVLDPHTQQALCGGPNNNRMMDDTFNTAGDDTLFQDLDGNSVADGHHMPTYDRNVKNATPTTSTALTTTSTGMVPIQNVLPMIVKFGQDMGDVVEYCRALHAEEGASSDDEGTATLNGDLSTLGQDASLIAI